MESPWPENLPNNRRKAIEELNRGRELATQLQIELRKPVGDHGSVSAGDLVSKILGSFTEVLSVLNSGESGEVCQDPAIAHASSPCCDDRGTEDSGESRKTLGSNYRRGGGYKRRKISQTWIKVTATPIEDGYAWRKYGQKEILNAKHPRSYFRCTHRNDQGCPATKQVQKTEDERPMFRTTYIGHHTCKAVAKAPQFIMDSTSMESYLLSFESNNPTRQQRQPFFSSFPVKQEYREEILSDPTTNHNPSSSGYLFSPDLTTLVSSGPTTLLPSTPGSDHGDVVSDMYSGTTSSPSLDMVVGSVDFDDVFRFDEDELFQGSI